MNEVNPEQFADFFEALHGHSPFPWQERLAQTVCTRQWPEVIDLPTASGKTACLDIALFALAATGKSARRIFFVVDRRVIVNEAFQRMKKIADTLSTATTGILAAAADSLRNLAGPNSAAPLSVYQLRGGIYRDQSWLRSPLQPMIVTSTVDQIGSRILFRGYGVSDSSAPLHAALIANDSLIFLDEAHCSRAFSQTLGSIKTYRSDEWARTPLKKTFSFVEMTATPSQEVDLPFRLEAKDHENEFLKLRLYAPKPTTLHPVKARANDREALAKSLAHQAVAMASDSGGNRIAVMVNRVATARRVFEILSKQISAQNLHLLIGRMRPIDRDKLVERLNPLKAGSKRDTQVDPTFVVSTQCLEVGADLDFDVLVTECASIDALLQRFGRLDRLGTLSGEARGCIITTTGTADAKDADPIYGHCLAETWRWLNNLAQTSSPLNMGIESADLNNPTVAQLLKLLPKEESAKMRRMGTDAPALLPSHLDAFTQTSPRPYADPDVALFLHGRQDGPAEIQVVWRKDLDDVPVDSWKAIVALCPPVSAEAMPVRLSQFRAWLTGGAASLSNDDSDMEGIGGEDDDSQQEQTRFQDALIWRGDQSDVVKATADIKPNDTVILSLTQHGWEEFGHIPEPVEDVAEEAIRQARARIVFRVHRKLWPSPNQLDKLLQNEEFDWELWRELVDSDREFLELHGVASPNGKDFKPPLPYPSKAGTPPPGWILQPKIANQPALAGRIQIPLGEDDGNDETSLADSPITLDDHTRDVKEAVQTLASKLLPDFSETLGCAAYLHDSGKSDPRFQVMLHGGDHMAAAFDPAILAKAEMLTNGLFQTAKKKSELPDHFRHELVSLHFAAKHCSDRTDRELIMHLIASHHGYCRPFAPLVVDTDPRDMQWNGLAITTGERLALPAHQMSSGVVRRFWRATRDFGWWGAAYLEACLRLADWAASELEQKANDK